jgi:DNA invertase Pin-like site-specific DNA recombinase
MPRCTHIYEDWISGARDGRLGLALTFEVARRRDQLVIWRLDCLDRSMSNLSSLTHALREHRIKVRSLTDGIDTSTTGGKFTFHPFAALAEFGRAVIRERTQARYPPPARGSARVNVQSGSISRSTGTLEQRL